MVISRQSNQPYSKGGNSSVQEQSPSKLQSMGKAQLQENVSVNHIAHLAQQGFMKPQAAQLSLNVTGRLSHYMKNWQTLTTDTWVIEMVQGFQIPACQCRSNS